MDFISDLASPIIIGILLGGLYVVVALGLSLVFGVMKVINVAHGTLVILGSYLAFATLSTLGIDPILGLLIGIPVFFLFGILIEKYLLNRAVKMSADAALIIAFGILDFTAAIVVMLVIHQFLKRTYLGQAITASSQDRQTAELMGINPNRVYQIAFGIAMALAAVGGVFFGITFPFTPTTGNALLIIAFGVIILGGLGSMVGTFIGGVIFGLSQTLGGHFFGPTGQLIVPFLMVLVVLTIRPQGLFGR